MNNRPTDTHAMGMTSAYNDKSEINLSPNVEGSTVDDIVSSREEDDSSSSV